MNIFLDVMILLAVIGGVVCSMYKSRRAAIASLSITVVTLVAAWLLSMAGTYATALAVRPLVFSVGVRETALLTGAPVEKKTQDTLENIDPERIFTADEESLEVLADKFGFSVEDLKESYRSEENLTKSPVAISEALIREMVRFPAERISRMTAWVILYVVLYFVLRKVCRLVFHNQFRQPKKKHFSAFSGALGLVSGILLVVFLIVPCVRLLIPCEIGILETLRLPESANHSVLYGLFDNNFFVK